ncbi:hypothetical protein [Salinirubrum litoreum]|uniref:CHAT domain-containing protein n=1 Tax=Salinirubrum litoreum TaxID=1126234 RepID=A0ABD5RAG4_9EURY|nr:hypothetical protein [Salinirubrum litoreum]
MFDEEFPNRSAHTPSIHASDASGLRVHDPIQHTSYELQTPGAVRPTPVTNPPFEMPVDTAVGVETDSLTVPWSPETYVFRDGHVVAETQYDETRHFATGPLTLQVNSGPTVLYLHAPAGVRIVGERAHVRYEFDDPVVTVGVRSYHDDPAGTVTTTSDPTDLCRAVSRLGSALKTTGPERSFPTLRGHPPLLELGSSFAVSGSVEPLDTGVSIEVPADPEYVFPVGSLAFYTGATVVPGGDPRLYADGESWSLSEGGRLANRVDVAGSGDRSADGRGSSGSTFERVVAEVLKHVFVLDCVTRTYGYYPVETRERAAVESRTAVDFASLYDASLAERVAAYLSVPFESVTPSRPVWRMTADLEPRVEHVELLPYTARNLATVRCPDPDPVVSDAEESAAVSSFFRAGDPADDERRPVGSLPATDDEVRLPDTSAREHVWAGEGVPQNASLLTRPSFRRALQHEPKSEAAAVVDVVCNDHRMASEGDSWPGSDAGTDDRLDVQTHYDLSVAELEALFRQDTDFLHYVGHVDTDGFRCADGHFDARTLERTGVESFLLNACRSYTQGRALIERGSVGGLVTLSRVGNESASRIGRLFARLLGTGYTLSATTSIARIAEASGRRYVGLGVQDFEVVTNVGGHQLFNVVERVDGAESAGEAAYDLTVHSYPVSRNGLGTVGRTLVGADSDSERFLVPPGGETCRVSRTELLEYLELDTTPVLLDGRLYWSDELDDPTL